MPQICLYLHLHQPNRIQPISVFEVGNGMDYFDSSQNSENRKIFEKVATKSYRPMLGVLKKLLDRHEKFHCSLSLSGVFLDQAERFAPDVISLIKQIVSTGRVEILAETYFHSLASLYSQQEFERQILLHISKIEEVFGVTPNVFRNTELIYSNDIAHQLRSFNFAGILTEAVDRYLHGRSKTRLYASNTPERIPLLLKHAQLSDDIAFRFSDRNWQWYPLQVADYLQWVEVYGEKELINLFMDFETFGEHQWEDSGIFHFFERFIGEFLSRPWNSMVTPSQVCLAYTDKRGGIKRSSQVMKRRSMLPVYDVPEPISWADVDRDISAWRDNDFQYDTLESMYGMESDILHLENEELTLLWRNLQISDHFYYMCTKWSADGDVHAYFSHYESPFEAYRRFAIALADLKGRVNSAKKVLKIAATKHNESNTNHSDQSIPTKNVKDITDSNIPRTRARFILGN